MNVQNQSMGDERGGPGRQWSPPRLTVYGTLKELTEKIGGTPDGDGGSFVGDTGPGPGYPGYQGPPGGAPGGTG
jgi:hypothetical protein